VNASAPAGAPYISVIVPIYNEEESIGKLLPRLYEVLDRLPHRFEVIAVNDGSRDGSLAMLRAAALLRPQLKIVNFRRNFGQTAALMAGIDYAAGEVIVPIDADLQNDPDDIPLLLAKLEEGFDVVSGWRKDRKDASIRRNLLSRMANRLISLISRVRLNDYGCTLKAYRREVIKDVRLYGEMHRFVPIYAAWQGARVTELPVRHHPRQYGKSKYGLERVFKVVLDLLVVKFLDRQFVKPIYVFGGFGLFSFALAGLAALYMFYLKFAEGVSMIQTPLPLLSAMALLVGVMSVLMGLLAEMLVRVYFESQNRSPYLVRDLTNFDDRVPH
jgi:glycosyltransferase involved in cell wall biosynthesis